MTAAPHWSDRLTDSGAYAAYAAYAADAARATALAQCADLVRLHVPRPELPEVAL